MMQVFTDINYYYSFTYILQNVPVTQKQVTTFLFYFCINVLNKQFEITQIDKKVFMNIMTNLNHLKT